MVIFRILMFGFVVIFLIVMLIMAAEELKKMKIHPIGIILVCGIICACYCSIYYAILSTSLNCDIEEIEAQEEIIKLAIKKRDSSYEVYFTLLEESIGRDNEIIKAISDARKPIDSDKISEADMEKIVQIVLEKYPELDTSQFDETRKEFVKIQEEMYDKQEKLIKKIKDYNKKIQTFPYNVLFSKERIDFKTIEMSE